MNAAQALAVAITAIMKACINDEPASAKTPVRKRGQAVGKTRSSSQPDLPFSVDDAMQAVAPIPKPPTTDPQGEPIPHAYRPSRDGEFDFDLDSLPWLGPS